MLVGRVVGQVWATKKQETLEGIRFLLVRPLALSGHQPRASSVADVRLPEPRLADRAQHRPARVPQANQRRP